MKYVIVIVDYFTKWAKVVTLATITEKKITTFIERNLICKFGISYALITDNGKQFDNTNFREFYSSLNIDFRLVTSAHLKVNGQVKVVNKIIKNTLKKRLDDRS